VIDGASSGHPSDVPPANAPLAPLDLGESEGPAEISNAERSARLRVLVDAHFDFIWRSLRRFGLSNADADDAAQRVFVIASRKLAQIESGKERPYLFGTAYRVVREIRRSRARKPEAPLANETEVADPGLNPEEFADHNRARVLLDEVLSEMPMEARTIFVLFELEEMTVPQIATLLDVPLGTVASRLRRGRELFRAAAVRMRARANFHGGT
jgi:RNA polymerase sigma-70 factor (ECF subfamily)